MTRTGDQQPGGEIELLSFGLIKPGHLLAKQTDIIIAQREIRSYQSHLDESFPRRLEFFRRVVLVEHDQLDLFARRHLEFGRGELMVPDRQLVFRIGGKAEGGKAQCS